MIPIKILNAKDILYNPKSVINRTSVIDKRSQDNESFTRSRSLNNKYVSENQDWEQKYLKYKNKYLSLKQKMEN